MCRELMLIIEVDGITHSYEEVAENDEIRQKKLEGAGFKVLRFTDEEVLQQLNRVEKIIELEVTKIMEEKGVMPTERKRRRRRER